MGEQFKGTSQSNRPNTMQTEYAATGREILKLLNSPALEEPTDPNATDLQILDRLTKQLEPTFDYLDLLAQNISDYINEKKVKSKSIQELLQGTVQIEKFLKEKLADASKNVTNPIITNLLRLTAHDVSLFGNFGRISTILNSKIKNKHKGCEKAWNNNQTGVLKSLLAQKELLSSCFRRVKNLSEGGIGLHEEISRENFLKNLGKLFDQIQLDNWKLEPSITTRLTLNNQAITQSTDKTGNPFDQTFTEEDFPIKLDQVLLNSILRNIINNAIENSPSDSKLNLEINIVKKTDTDKKKPYLHIKLSNPLADPIGFTKKNILKALQDNQQVTTKQDPTETNGTFLQTLNNLMQENGGLLKIRTTTKDQSLENLENSDFKIKIPLTAVPRLKDLYQSFSLKNTIHLENIEKDHSHRLVNIKDLIIKANQSRSRVKKDLMNQFLSKHSNVSLGKKSSQTLKTLEFNLELKYPLHGKSTNN